MTVASCYLYAAATSVFTLQVEGTRFSLCL